jgi:DNA-binding NtrC family response regulator
MSPRILIVDDEQTIQGTLRWCFEEHGFEVGTAGSGEEAIARLQAEEFDAVVADIILPGISGLEVLRRSRSLGRDIIVVLITAYATVETAVEALRLGANDYVVKPFQLQDLLFRVRRLLPVQATNQTAGPDPAAEPLLGRSRAIEEIRVQIARLAGTSSNILITGETGTGKEVVARAVHAASRRRDQRFVRVNCGAIPEALFESHLFGHVKGAVPSAIQAHAGLFTLAHQGTLFLDEVTELPLAAQTKLVRVIEDNEVWAVGATKPTSVDSRIIAATNRDLRQEMEAGRFREDLFYRLNVTQVSLPPLRERREDISLLAAHFVEHLNSKLNRRVTAIDPAALHLLIEHDWPGNVRELEHMLESVMITLEGSRINEEAVSAKLDGRRPSASLREAIRHFERQQIMAVLALSQFDKREAARRLGLSLASLYRKLEGHTT